MKAVVYTEYGTEDKLTLQELDIPTPKADEILIRLRATALNSSDWEFLTAANFVVRLLGGIFKPKFPILGSDIAGTIEKVGKDITVFQPGDEVFGDIFMRMGGLAQYACVSEKNLLRKPASLTFEQAAALPQAGVLALQGLRDSGGIKKGQKVLINGAGGGAGSFAIQLAKYFGAIVTAVDSERKLELMDQLGADHVIDYLAEDYSRSDQKYDLILDMVASRSLYSNQRALAPNGTYVVAGGSMKRFFLALLLGPFIKVFTGKKMGVLAHHQNKKDMRFMMELLENGKVRAVIDKCHPLEETATALRYLGDGQARGKVVITMGQSKN